MSKATAGIRELKDEVKSSEGSEMETDQTEQLDALLNQSAKSVKNHNTEEMDASTTSQQHNRSPSPFDSKETQVEIVMVEKRDTNLIACKQQLEFTGKVAPSNFRNP